MASIEELRAKVERLREELRIAQTRLHEAEVTASGVRVGDIVRGTGHRTKGKSFRVTLIEPNYPSNPWLRGNPQRVDSSFGTREVRLYDDWEPVL